MVKNWLPVIMQKVHRTGPYPEPIVPDRSMRTALIPDFISVEGIPQPVETSHRPGSLHIGSLKQGAVQHLYEGYSLCTSESFWLRSFLLSGRGCHRAFK
jgi:hypothetical protein